MGKNILIILMMFCSNCAFSQFSSLIKATTYTYNGDVYSCVSMTRNGERIKAKYFAVPQYSKNVPQRFAEWERDRSVVTYCSGAYADRFGEGGRPVGLTVDNGVIINNNLISDMDGLVIIQATGGVVATNLKDGDLRLEGDTKTYDLRNNPMDLVRFRKWCVDKQATVFQTHLLTYKNRLLISRYKSMSTKNGQSTSLRRFLAVGRDLRGDIQHVIIVRDACTLFDGAQGATEMLLNKGVLKEIIFMVNLDTGGKNVARCYNGNGQYYNVFEGTEPIGAAINLIAYYYE